MVATAAVAAFCCSTHAVAAATCHLPFATYLMPHAACPFLWLPPAGVLCAHLIKATNNHAFIMLLSCIRVCVCQCVCVCMCVYVALLSFIIYNVGQKNVTNSPQLVFLSRSCPRDSIPDSDSASDFNSDFTLHLSLSVTLSLSIPLSHPLSPSCSPFLSLPLSFPL